MSGMNTTPPISPASTSESGTTVHLCSDSKTSLHSSAATSTSYKGVTDYAHLQATLEDTLAQLEVTRQQRTEVSAQLFKCQCSLDELKEQRAHLQSELNRRLQTHKEDVNRIVSLQSELDSVRRTYNANQTEIIDLSSKIQTLRAKLENTEQYGKLKEENELLWRKVEDLKKYEALEASGELNSRDSKWKERFAVLESALNEALESRRSLIGDLDYDMNGDVDGSILALRAILDAEEKIRRSVSHQMSSLRMEFRSTKDAMEEMLTKIAECDTAAIKSELEIKRLIDANKELEADRDKNLLLMKVMKQDAERPRKELAEALAKISQMEGAMSQLICERDELRKKSTSDDIEHSQKEQTRIQADLALRAQYDAQEKQVYKLRERLKEELRHKDVQLARVMEEKRELEQTVNTLRNELDSDRAALQTIESRLKSYSVEGDIASNEQLTIRLPLQSNASSHKELKMAEHSRGAVHSEVDMFISVFQRKVSDLASMQDRVQELEANLESERNRFNTNNENWCAREKHLQQEIIRLKNQSLDPDEISRRDLKERSLERELKAALDMQLSLQDEVQMQHYEIAELRRNLAHNEESPVDAIASAGAEVALKEAEARISELEALVQRISIELRDSQDRLGALSNDASKLPLRETEAALLKAQIEENGVQIADLEKEVQQLQSMREATELELKQARNSHAKDAQLLREQVKAIEQILSTLQRNLISESCKAEMELPGSSNVLQQSEKGIEDTTEITSLIKDTMRDVPLPQQLTNLKLALIKLSSTAREKEALLMMYMSRYKESEAQNISYQAQIRKIEEEWKQEYEGYLTNLARVTASLERVTSEKKALQEQLDRKIQLITNKGLGQHIKRLAGDLVENSSTTSSPTSTRGLESPSRGKRALERSVEEWKRKYLAIQETMEKCQCKDLSKKRTAQMPKSSLGKEPVNAFTKDITPYHISIFMTACYLSYLAGSLAM